MMTSIVHLSSNRSKARTNQNARITLVIANEPAERREAAENSAARRIAYAKNSRSAFESVSVRCNNGSV